jgi:hypothetical protein
MTERLELFVGLSVLLTGFDTTHLRGTGMAEEYLRFLDQILPPEIVEDLLSCSEKIPLGPECERVAETEILGSPRLGPVARNLIVLWYCGTWTQLPAAWRAAFGAAPQDTTQVVSAAAYQTGLQWAVAGAHPSGAKQQGYGAWALGPERSER